jgi:hypothetical protein
MKLQDIASDPLNIICEFLSNDRKSIHSLVYTNSKIASSYAQTPIFTTTEISNFLLNDSMNISGLTTMTNNQDIDWLELTGRKILRRVLQTPTLNQICDKNLDEKIIYSYRRREVIDNRVTLFTQYPSMMLSLMKYFKMELSTLKFPPQLEPVEVTNLKELQYIVNDYSAVPEDLLEKSFSFSRHNLLTEIKYTTRFDGYAEYSFYNCTWSSCI